MSTSNHRVPWGHLIALILLCWNKRTLSTPPTYWKTPCTRTRTRTHARTHHSHLLYIHQLTPQGPCLLNNSTVNENNKVQYSVLNQLLTECMWSLLCTLTDHKHETHNVKPRSDSYVTLHTVMWITCDKTWWIMKTFSFFVKCLMRKGTGAEETNPCPLCSNFAFTSPQNIESLFK